MSNTVSGAICHTGIAVNLVNVKKHFIQKQLAASARDLLKPKKKIICALDDLSFEVERGEFVAYAGPNGAGKSTTVKLLGGMLLPNEGEISVLGLSPDKNRIALMKRLGILFGNRTELWWDHPVRTSFQWKQKVFDIPMNRFEQMEKLVLEFLNIEPFYDTFARELSLGQRMRADLGMMLLHRPELILLDEPTLGLDVLAKRQMIKFLRTLNEREGTTIVVTSHDMDDLEEMARRIMLIADGKMAFDGEFSALRERLDLKRIAIVQFGDGHEETYMFTDPKQMLLALSQKEGISDIRFTQTSLEEGIANLYASWNALA